MSLFSNKFRLMMSCSCVTLALLLLTPTFMSLVSSLRPDVGINLVLENSMEEEKEEERSSAEEDMKELKEFTLPSESAKKNDYILLLQIKHNYTIRPYSSVLTVLDLPPEVRG